MHNYAEDIKERFLSYAGSFSSLDPDIQRNLVLKKEHTLRVCKEITGIAVAEGLPEKDLRTAQITALLHDIGRFEQYTRYKTFSDSRSVNHAELGIAVAKDLGIVRDIPDHEQALVLDAVAYHNRPHIPEGLDERTMLFAKLIRDADKLDILHLLALLYRNPDTDARSAVELTLPSRIELSAKAVESVYRESIVKFADLHSADDFKVLQMAWIFDLNFVYSLRQFHERGHLESLREALPDTAIVRDLYGFTRKKLLERLER